MQWPLFSVDTVDPSDFVPPFCPWSECPTHRGGARFHRHGSYRTAAAERPIQRYRCATCRRTCSRQTFSTTYYLKQPQLLQAIAAGLLAGSAHRQLGRSLECAKTTVLRQARRLARHAILLHALVLEAIPRVDERIVYDHFETFVGSQDRALAIGTPMGARSWFCYGPDFASHRRAGRIPGAVTRSAWQGPPRPYVEAMRQTLDLLAPRIAPGAKLELVFDGWQDYVRAVDSHAARPQLRYVRHVNPDRRARKAPTPQVVARDEAMHPVDSYHGLLRHSCAEHKRETISFGRRLEAIAGRAFLATVWRNLIKAHLENSPRTTPAMTLGLTQRPWRWRNVLAHRLFPTRFELPAPWKAIYDQALTPGAPTYRLRHAG